MDEFINVKRLKIVLLSIALLSLLGIIFFIISYFYSEHKLDRVNSISKITKIEMDIDDGATPKHFIITDSSTLNEINKMLKKNIKFKADRVKIHSVFINMDIYFENRKIYIQVLNTEYSGWLVVIGDMYYKNDSLIKQLKKYI